MKAIVFDEYGGPEVLKIKEIEKPLPEANEVLIKVYATTVTAGDWRVRKADPFLARLFNGLFRPKKVKVLGFELCGKVENIGASVTRFKVGDMVYGSCGFDFGAYAEYAILTQDALIIKKPESMPVYEAAALGIGGLSANCLLQRVSGGIKNKRIMIYGASGSVGSYLVQMAKYYGAHVTGVCSGKNSDVVLALGADEVIDYKTTDMLTYKESFDVVFDAVGKLPGSVRKKLVHTLGETHSINQVKGSPKIEDMEHVGDLFEKGIIRPLIDKIYELNDIVEAHRYVESFRKVGNVVVKVGGETSV